MNNRSTDQTSLPAGPRRPTIGTARCDCPAHRSPDRKTTTPTRNRAWVASTKKGER